MTKLSKYEKETIINGNEAQDPASIYHLPGQLQHKPRLSIRLVPPYSEERLAAAREYAKQHGFQVLRTDKKSA